MIRVLVLASLFWSGWAQSQTIINVSNSNLNGWLVGPFGTPPNADFVEGPGTPPSGTGSYAAQITVGNSKTILARNDFHDLPLSDLTALSANTWRDASATNPNNWYFNLYVDADGDGSADERLDWVLPNNSAVDTWESFDLFAGDGSLTSNMGFAGTIQDFLTANPNARFNAFDLPDGGAVRINQGDTAMSYVGYSGAIDSVRIAHNTLGDRLFDLEATGIPPAAVPILDPIGLVLLTLVLLAIGNARLRVQPNP